MLLRKIQLSDLEMRVLWMNDPRIYVSMHYDTPILLENTIMWFDRNANDDTRCDLTILDKGEIVAFGGITSIDKKVGKAESYIFVNPNCLQRGIGGQSLKLICKYGFDVLGLNKLYIFTNEDNVKSIKAHEKCGFVLEGRLRQEYLTADGRRLDRLYFGLLKEDWQNLNGNSLY